MRKQIDLTTLPGWANLSSGNHTIKIKAKGTGYIDSELSAGVVVSKAPSSGETWLLNDSDALTESNQDFTSLNFTSDSQSFVRILRQYNNSPIPPVNSLLYYKSDGTYVTAVYTNDDGIAFWNRQAYRTLTFDTAPTGDLLTWLQANGVKQTGYKLTLTSPTIYSGGSSDFYIKFNGTASATDYDIHCWGTGNNNPPTYPAYHIKDKSGNEISLPKDFTGITSLSTYAASTNYFGITVNGISIESESKTIDITGDATVSITIDSDY